MEDNVFVCVCVFAVQVLAWRPSPTASLPPCTRWSCSGRACCACRQSSPPPRMRWWPLCCRCSGCDRSWTRCVRGSACVCLYPWQSLGLALHRTKFSPYMGLRCDSAEQGSLCISCLRGGAVARCHRLLGMWCSCCVRTEGKARPQRCLSPVSRTCTSPFSPSQVLTLDVTDSRVCSALSAIMQLQGRLAQRGGGGASLGKPLDSLPPDTLRFILQAVSRLHIPI